MVEETTEIKEISSAESGFDPVWAAGAVLITVTATLFRFLFLTLKPLHHDEGVNGFFLTTLFRDGVYKYDPANYHGPTLYFISLFFAKIGGLNTWSIRSSVAVFGVLTVVLTFFLKRYLGKIGSLAAGLFIAISPGMVYISRYFIHEIFFVFCSLSIVVAAVYFIEKRKAGPFAIAWAVLLLFIAFLPSGIQISSYVGPIVADLVGGSNDVWIWIFRSALFLVEAVLVYFVVRMLLDWDNGRPIYLLLTTASTALLFATKETAFITLGTMLISCLSVYIWRGIYESDQIRGMRWMLIIAAHALVLIAAVICSSDLKDGIKWVYDNFLGDGRVQEPFAFYTIVVLTLAVAAAWIAFLISYRRENEPSFTEPAALTPKNLIAAIGEGNSRWLALAAVAATFVYLIVIFFSSFFTYAEGVQKAVEAYTLWTKTGTKEHTQNGIWAYVKWGIKVETPLLLLSALGSGIALLKTRHRFAMFTAFWAFGMFAAYTIIPYKTPWLALSFYLPMCLIAGYGIGQLVTSRSIISKTTGIAVLIAAISLLGYQAYDLNFVRYDDEEMGYVYAHSKRGMLDLVAQIEHYATKSERGYDTTVEIVSPDYWPLTWYLNDFKNARFDGALVDANTAELIIAKKNDQDIEAVKRYSAHYKFVGVYPLRPGVDLMLLVRKDIADPDTQDLYKIYEYTDKIALAAPSRDGEMASFIAPSH